MAKAVLCPVCNGSGEKVIPAPVGGSSVLPSIIPCHGCGGKGWVEVSAPTLKPDEYIALQRKVTLICPDCGGDRDSPPGTECKPGSHYGHYIEEHNTSQGAIGGIGRYHYRWVGTI